MDAINHIKHLHDGRLREIYEGDAISFINNISSVNVNGEYDLDDYRECAFGEYWRRRILSRKTLAYDDIRHIIEYRHLWGSLSVIGEFARLDLIAPYLLNDLIISKDEDVWSYRQISARKIVHTVKALIEIENHMDCLTIISAIDRLIELKNVVWAIEELLPLLPYSCLCYLYNRLTKEKILTRSHRGHLNSLIKKVLQEKTQKESNPGGPCQ